MLRCHNCTYAGGYRFEYNGRGVPVGLTEDADGLFFELKSKGGDRFEMKKGVAGTRANQKRMELTAFEQLGPRDKFLLAVVFIVLPLVLIGLIVGIGF